MTATPDTLSNVTYDALCIKVTTLQTTLKTTRMQADKAVQTYQSLHQSFHDWLRKADETYFAKRTEKMNRIEALRQELAKIRLDTALEVARYRQAWIKTLPYLE